MAQQEDRSGSLKRSWDEVASGYDHVLDELRQDKMKIFEVPKQLFEDPSFALAAADVNRCALIFASPTLRADREFMLSAIDQNTMNLMHASEPLCSDRSFVLEVLENHPDALMHVDDKFRSDGELALAAIRKDPSAIGFVSQELMADADFVLEAGRHSEIAFAHASQSLLANREFVLRALRISPRILIPVIPAINDMRADPAFALTAATTNGQAIIYLPEAFGANRDVVLAAVRNDPQDEAMYAFAAASRELRSDRQIAMEAIQHRMGAACFLAGALRDDHELFVHAVSFRPDKLQTASPTIRADVLLTAGSFETLRQVQAFLRDALEVRPAFMTFLCCVFSKKRNPTSTLKKDDDTTQGLVQHIAGYAGFPFGKSLDRFRIVERTVPILEAYFGNDAADALEVFENDFFIQDDEEESDDA